MPPAQNVKATHRALLTPSLSEWLPTRSNPLAFQLSKGKQLLWAFKMGYLCGEPMSCISL